MVPIRPNCRRQKVIRLCILGVVGSLVLFLLLAMQSFSRQRPWTFSRIFGVREAIDLNSGDTAEWTYVFGLQIAETIRTSPFSQELRGSGVHVPGVRKWKLTYARVPRGRLLATDNVDFIAQCDMVVKLLDLLKGSDPERSVLLAKALTILQSGDRRAMKDFTMWLAAKGKNRVAS